MRSTAIRRTDRISIHAEDLVSTDSYRDGVLQAVNLGFDTDTTAAITGGLAGLYVGYHDIPEEWLNKIARREWVEELCE